MSRLVMFLAASAVAALVLVTWAMTKVSAWIVFHDPVWAQMDKEGARLEHELAEAFFVARSVYLPWAEAFLGMFFIALLWRELSRKTSESGK